MPQFTYTYANAKYRIGQEEEGEPQFFEAADDAAAIAYLHNQIRTNGVDTGHFESDYHEVGALDELRALSGAPGKKPK